MSRSLRNKRGEFLRKIAPLGWTHVGFVSSGHLMVEHTNGATASIASTPGGWATENHELAKLKRLARPAQLQPLAAQPQDVVIDAASGAR
jgi:hypothetical protein